MNTEAILKKYGGLDGLFETLEKAINTAIAEKTAYMFFFDESGEVVQQTQSETETDSFNLSSIIFSSIPAMTRTMLNIAGVTPETIDDKIREAVKEKGQICIIKGRERCRTFTMNEKDDTPKETRIKNIFDL